MTDWMPNSNCVKAEEAYAKEHKDETNPVKRSILYMFFDGYESDWQVPPETDAMCLSCPVIRECFSKGTRDGETGVFGGIYLNKGKIDKNKNAHKTPEIWAEFQEVLF